MGCGTSTRKGEPRCKLQYRKSKEFFDEIDRGGKLILFEDLILNGEALARWHPGGDKFISSLVGKEVSRYFYSSFGAADSQARAQSEQTLAKLGEFVVGRLYNPYVELLFSKSDVETLTGDKDCSAGGGGGGPIHWTLQGRTMVTSDHALLRFCRPDLKSPVIIPSFELYGKYITLTAEGLRQSRNYTLVFSLSPSIYPMLMEMVAAFKKRQPFPSRYTNFTDLYKSGIEIFVKRGPNVSRFLHELPLHYPSRPPQQDNAFTIRGFGFKYFQGGTVVGIALGTPVLLFADLAAYILRKNVYKAGRVVKKPYKLFSTESFEALDDDSFKLVLLSSFHKRSEVIGKELFETTEELSKEFMFGNFEYHLRVGEEGTPRWDADFFRSKLDCNVAKVIVCGPPQAVESVQDILTQQVGVSKSMIWSL